MEYQTKEFDYKNEIITTSHNKKLIINDNKKTNKTKYVNWNAWKTYLNCSLNKYLKGNVALNSKSSLDTSISSLTKIINDTAQKCSAIGNY